MNRGGLPYPFCFSGEAPFIKRLTTLAVFSASARESALLSMGCFFFEAKEEAVSFAAPMEQATSASF